MGFFENNFSGEQWKQELKNNTRRLSPKKKGRHKPVPVRY